MREHKGTPDYSRGGSVTPSCDLVLNRGLIQTVWAVVVACQLVLVFLAEADVVGFWARIDASLEPGIANVNNAVVC